MSSANGGIATDEHEHDNDNEDDNDGGVTTPVTRRRLIAAGLALAGAAILFLPLCDLVFDCGCTWPLVGGSAHCDMHAPQPPHCPLCRGPRVYGLAFSLALWGALFVPIERLLRRKSARG